MAITLLGVIPLTLQRRGPTDYASGRPVFAAPVDVEIQATVFIGADTAILPSGKSISYDAYAISYSPIQVASEISESPADRFTHEGHTYEAQVIVAEQPAFLGQPKHWEVTALEVAANPMPEG